MGGSKGGKHSKNKGKSKSKKSDANSKKPEGPNSKLDLVQKPNNDSQGPKDAKGSNPQPNTNIGASTSMSSYTDEELEEMLLFKVHDLYKNAKDWLLRYGYSEEDVKRAILSNGNILGPNKPLDNILTNSMAVLENKFKPERDAFEDLCDLCDNMQETLVDHTMRTFPYMQRPDVVRGLLSGNWGYVPSVKPVSQHRAEDQSPSSDLLEDEDLLTESHRGSPSQKVGIFRRLNLTPECSCLLKQRVRTIAAAIRQEIGIPGNQDATRDSPGVWRECPADVETDFTTSLTSCLTEEFHEGLMESDVDDPRDALIFDLLQSITDLEEKVKETKEWAQQKVLAAAKTLSKHQLELKMLCMAKMNKGRMLIERNSSEKACISKLVEKERILQKVMFQAKVSDKVLRKLDAENAQIRADNEAFKLNESETDRKLKDILKKERKWLRKLSDLGKQKSSLQAQCDEHKQRLLQLDHELLQVEKEAEEAETKWMQEIQEREQMSACLAEEIRMNKTREANSRAMLLGLRQKLEIDSQLAQDEYRRLEYELSRLRISNQVRDVLPADESVFYDNPLALSCASNVLCESSRENIRHRNCIICSENEVNVVFLPCTHQVVCLQCYERNCSTVGGKCPCCQVGIEQSIRVFGPGS